jgi:hypothetical protein
VIAAVPGLTPETLPPITEATAPLLVDHPPPEVASVSNVEDPAQTAFVPTIEFGSGFTVKEKVLLQPVANE